MASPNIKNFKLLLNNKFNVLVLFVIFTLIHTNLIASFQNFTYPKTKRNDSIEDNYHGTLVKDPYRWLEELESNEVRHWIQKQNDLTNQFLVSSLRKQFKKRIAQLMNYEEPSIPWKIKTYYFSWKRYGLMNQRILVMAKNADGLKTNPQLLLDPNKLSKDGTASIRGGSFTKDASLYAYNISRNGSDWLAINVFNIANRKSLSDILRGIKFSGCTAWTHDKTGFFYRYYPFHRSKDPSVIHKNYIYWHQIGNKQELDIRIFPPQNSDVEKHLNNLSSSFLLEPSITNDGQYIFVNVYFGSSSNNEIYYQKIRDLNLNQTPPSFKSLFMQSNARYYYVHNKGTVFYFLTNKNAPNWRIIAIDITNPNNQNTENFQDIIPEDSESVIDFANIINNQLVIVYTKDIKNMIKIYSLQGRFVRSINLPIAGSITRINGEYNDTEMFFNLSSLNYPTVIFNYDFKSNKLTKYFKSPIDFNNNHYVLKQTFYQSKDGTRIPMFITHHKKLKMDGNNPTLLTGYGGFSSSYKPSFSTKIVPWLQNKGVYAIANIRGGGEYGERWHKAGMLNNKQNAFDDFCAAARFLIKQKYTSSKKLAIKGRSNGGLLIAACITQCPELFGAAIISVPLTDMLRYHLFIPDTSRLWITEYGKADNLNMFPVLYAYSPVHNTYAYKRSISKKRYPSTIILTTNDDRVSTAHALKLTAALQYSQAENAPVLLSIQSEIGHMTDMKRTIEWCSNYYTFLYKELILKSNKTK